MSFWDGVKCHCIADIYYIGLRIFGNRRLSGKRPRQYDLVEAKDGDKDEICGGMESVNVFEPIETDEDESTTTSSTTTPTTTTGPGGNNDNRVDNGPAESGARRNVALFSVYFTTGFGRLSIVRATRQKEDQSQVMESRKGSIAHQLGWIAHGTPN
ncbi:hypothetical protein BDW59DRAFT_156709 [Aspergillus cavernicola]|uniref:Uncharacterized protein n=1 Tax=Aspergillus cavernicola TaxID=176166 RepID=A0ABR4J4B9_9EURO